MCVGRGGGVQGVGDTSAHSCAFILTILCVFYVSVFLDREAVSNDDGQMSPFYPIGIFTYNVNFFFFLTFSVKLFRIFNEVMYSLKKICNLQSYQIWRAFIPFLCSESLMSGLNIDVWKETGQSKTF